ncbi:YdcF family protein [Thermodesulfobacteriota bacterium]
MKDLWHRISKGEDGLAKPSSVSSLLKGRNGNEPYGESEHSAGQNQIELKNEPIEPESKKTPRIRLFKFIIFLAIVIYAMVSLYQVPILRFMGRFLVIEQPLKKADAMLCLSGAPIERGLAASDLFVKGLAPKVIITRGPLPDGLNHLEKIGVEYQEPRDLLLNILKRRGVPGSSCFIDDRIVTSTFSEAALVKTIIDKEGYKSIIIITSPFHTRRAWLTFKEVLKDSNVDLIIYGSPYSDFSPEGWWKNRRYTKKVIIEYQKLIYYTLKYFL